MLCKSWVEISRSSLDHNFRQFRRLVPVRVKILSVVKANAYGHGLSEVVPILDRAGTDWFGVDSFEEAERVRGVSQKPVLIMGFLTEEGVLRAVEAGFSFCLYNFETLHTLASLKPGKMVKVHLKLETGTYRQGIPAAQLDRFLRELRAIPGPVVIEGVYTHLANVEDTLDPSYALRQMEIFDRLSRRGPFAESLKHLAATGAVLLYPESGHDLVRVGIGLWGLWPSREVQLGYRQRGGGRLTLKPVLSWKSVVAQVKKVAAGETVGYGRTWKALKDSRIAVVPVGYFDGYDRKLSNNAEVLVRNKRAPVVGRVAMNMFMIDVSQIEGVSVGDEVVLIGTQGEEEVSVDSLAERLGTINYEIVSRISPLLPRLVV